MAAKALDHIGVVVRDCEATANRIAEILRLTVEHTEDYGAGLITIAFIPVGAGPQGPKIELLQPNRSGSSAWEFLHRYGEGIEHIAFLVDDVTVELARLRATVPLRDQKARPGAGGMEIGFLDPLAITGMYVELVSPISPLPSERA